MAKSSKYINSLKTTVRKLFKGEQEQAPAHDDYLIGSWGFDNPDDLLAREGVGAYRIVADNDARVSAAIEDIVAGVLAPGFEVAAPKGAPAKTKKAAEFCEEVLRNLGGMRPDGTAYFDTIEQALHTMGHVALTRGFYVGEKVWTKDGGKDKLDQLKSKDPETVTFHIDRFGNLLTDGVEIDNGADCNRYPVASMVVWSVGQRFGNPYGYSWLRPVWRAYYLKDLCRRGLGIIAQRAGGLIVGTVPNGSKGDTADKLLDILQELKQEGVQVLPEGVEIDSVDVVSSSVKVLQETIRDCNTEISIALTGQTLASSEAQHGSRAQASTHEASRETRIRYVASLLERVVSEQVIRHICDRNFSTVGPSWVYPEFRFNDRDQVDTEKLSEEMVRGFNMGLIYDADQVYERLGWEKPKGAPDVIGKIPLMEAIAALQATGEPEEPEEPEEPKEPPEPGGDEPGDDEPGEGEPPKQPPKKGKAPPKQDIPKVPGRIPVSQGVGAASEHNGDGVTTLAEEPVVQPNAAIYWQHIGVPAEGEDIPPKSILGRALKAHEDWGAKIQAAGWELLEEHRGEWAQDPAGLKGITPPNVGSLQAILRKLRREVVTYGAKTAKGEIREGLAARGRSDMADDEPPDRGAFESFDFERGMEESAAKSTAEYQTWLRDGVAGGWDQAQAEAAFGKWFTTRQHQMESRYLTDFARTFNQSRMDTYRQSGAVQAVRVDPVLDDRTTPTCEAFSHNPVYALDDPALPVFPAHYRCRTVTTPVFTWENVKIEQVPADWTPAEGFA